jgi:myo-inositol catabolism protein IolC
MRDVGFDRPCTSSLSTTAAPLVRWRAGKSTREAAVAEVARRYREFVDVFERSRAA